MSTFISPSSKSMVEFYAELFGSHKALEKCGVPGKALAPFSRPIRKNKKRVIAKASSELSDELIADARDLIRIQLSPNGAIFLDVNRADGRIVCNHLDNGTIARFDPKTLPNGNIVPLQHVGHWSHWGEYVAPHSVVK